MSNEHFFETPGYLCLVAGAVQSLLQAYSLRLQDDERGKKICLMRKRLEK